MFKCTKGPCIHEEERCDSRPDCIDASDEIGCPSVQCPTSLDETNANIMIHCNHTTACILKDWICDGSNDCWDNSDEEHCNDDSKVHDDDDHDCPTERFFKCDSGRCISIGKY